MGAWRVLWATAAAALLWATRASGGTVVVPIARLSLEGGYDSNPLYDGRAADQGGRISPDVGVRLHAPLWDLRATYGGELVYYQRLAPSGIWNQRAGLALEATPTRRTALGGAMQISQAFDPAGLARLGVFRAGRENALVITGRGHLDWREERTALTSVTMQERTVLFEDRTGGAMHTPGVEALWRYGRRLQLGGAYGLGVFQSFAPAPGHDEISYAHALRARARWMASRHVSVSGFAGPALWLPPGGSAVVPEVFVEVLLATRGLDLRANAGHGLGLDATAHPGLVDAVEVGGERRFGRRWFLRGEGGVWRSGRAPAQTDAATGYAVGGEAGMRLARDVRMSLAVAHYGRVDDAPDAFDRTTVGLRLGWELPGR